ncbi:uncharacterized protein LOC125378564 [Haliotis rufescens]|uniref:uncharacterized protein LOC125378564 n=1 Tax=Haliotis rufescens TaxID=6454 RepID=UPI00201FA206|nr:uncharacterized protein LOC125378564 [Haliotis rufescens]
MSWDTLSARGYISNNGRLARLLKADGQCAPQEVLPACQSERSHWDWKSHLEFDHRKHGEGESFTGVEMLPAYARMHKERIHSALGCSPYKAMLGCPPVHFKNLLRAGNTVDASSCSEEDGPCELSAGSDEERENNRLKTRGETIQKQKDTRRLQL